MPPKRRLWIAGAAGAVFLIVLVGSFTLNRGVQREVLFSNLASADAAEVLRILEEQGIRYDLQQHLDGRATILVPSNVVHRTRIDMAAVGIPRQGSVGFEIFDETQLGMTDDVRRINLRRALNGELERTIRALDVVQDVRVQVALPENKLFISQQVAPTAAVMVTLRPGSRLLAEQVSAIQRLVGATIEGLSAEDVFVVDNRGNPLSDQLSQLSASNGATHVENQLLIQQAVSNEYTRQVRNLLEGPFGAGAVEAMVSVELNFERAEEIIMAFEAPNGRSGIVRSEQRLDERFEGVGSVPAEGGVPGVESNIPGYVGITATGDSEYTRFEEIINYEINQIETRREIPPGAVRRLSVAVLIDGELTQAQKDSVANTLTTALGLNTSRGDQVYVESFPFARRSFSEEVVAEESWSWTQLPFLLPFLAALALLLVWFGLRQRGKNDVGSRIDVTVGDDVEDETEPEEISSADKRRQQMRDEVRNVARDNPGDVAQLLKTWLIEE